MTPEQEAKRVQRSIRTIPVEQLAPVIAAQERDGMWCLVDGDLMFVPLDGSICVTEWDDPVEHALFVRYAQAHPERVHHSHEAAVSFVRWRLLH